MRTLATLAVVAFALTGCGENPHVLGEDPVRTPVEEIIENRTPSAGEPGQGGKDGCKNGGFRRDILVTVMSRAEAEGFSFDLTQLPARDSIHDVREARVVINELETSRAEEGAASVCLRNPDLCISYKDADHLKVNLGQILGKTPVEEVLYSRAALHLVVSENVVMNGAALQIRFSSNECYQYGNPDDKK